MANIFTNRQKRRFEALKKSIIFVNAMDLACRGYDGQNVDADWWGSASFITCIAKKTAHRESCHQGSSRSL
jgi:hypothetical protein